MPTIDELLDRARASLRRVTLADLPDDAVLVDIREDHQIAAHGELPGAVRIPRNVLECRCDPASPHRDPRVSDPSRPLVLVCHEGYQSSLAAATLQQLGHPRATDLIGGFLSLSARGVACPHGPSLAGDGAAVAGRGTPGGGRDARGERRVGAA